MTTRERIEKIIDLHHQMNSLLKCPEGCEIDLGGLSICYSVNSGIEHIAIDFDKEISKTIYLDDSGKETGIEYVEVDNILFMEVVR